MASGGSRKDGTMRRLSALLAITLLLPATAILAQEKSPETTAPTSTLEAWDGFRGIKWGTDIKTLPDMVLNKGFSYACDDFLVYSRKKDDVALGSIELDPLCGIRYGFYKGRFVWAGMKFVRWRGGKDYVQEARTARDILRARFGKETGELGPKLIRYPDVEQNSFYYRVTEWRNNDVVVRFYPDQAGNAGSPTSTAEFAIELTYLSLAHDKYPNYGSLKEAEEATRQAVTANFCGAAQGESAPSETLGSVWRGFRGIEWGTDVKTLPMMELVINCHNGFEIYRRKGDDLRLGDVALQQLHYGFYKGRLAWVGLVARPSKWPSYLIPLNAPSDDRKQQLEQMYHLCVGAFGKETSTIPKEPVVELISGFGDRKVVSKFSKEAGWSGPEFYGRAAEWKNKDVVVQFWPSTFSATAADLDAQPGLPLFAHISPFYDPAIEGKSVPNCGGPPASAELTYMPLVSQKLEDDKAAAAATKANANKAAERGF
jgi:hypothetical protein